MIMLNVRYEQYFREDKEHADIPKITEWNRSKTKLEHSVNRQKGVSDCAVGWWERGEGGGRTIIHFKKRTPNICRTCASVPPSGIRHVLRATASIRSTFLCSEFLLLHALWSWAFKRTMSFLHKRKSIYNYYVFVFQ